MLVLSLMAPGCVAVSVVSATIYSIQAINEVIWSCKWIITTSEEDSEGSEVNKSINYLSGEQNQSNTAKKGDRKKSLNTSTVKAWQKNPTFFVM